jgi:hypothetical protein
MLDQEVHCTLAVAAHCLTDLGSCAAERVLLLLDILCCAAATWCSNGGISWHRVQCRLAEIMPAKSKAVGKGKAQFGWWMGKQGWWGKPGSCGVHWWC